MRAYRTFHMVVSAILVALLSIAGIASSQTCGRTSPSIYSDTVPNTGLTSTGFPPGWMDTYTPATSWQMQNTGAGALILQNVTFNLAAEDNSANQVPTHPMSCVASCAIFQLLSSFCGLLGRKDKRTCYSCIAPGGPPPRTAYYFLFGTISERWSPALCFAVHVNVGQWGPLRERVGERSVHLHQQRPALRLQHRRHRVCI